MSAYRKEAKVDQSFDDDISDLDFSFTVMTRVRAVGKTFTKINFTHCIFDNCYFRNCAFVDCNFSGSKFTNSQLPGTGFKKPIFDYSTFEKTNITDDILSYCCPSYPKVKSDFARSLRINYSQLGLAESANKAINIELNARQRHLYEAWNSESSYYRDKYRGIKRIVAFLDWAKFMATHIIWGNGESIFKVIRLITVFSFFLAAIEFFCFKKAAYDSFVLGFSRVLLNSSNANDPKLLLLSVAVIKVCLFAMLTSVIIRRLSRR